MTGTGRTHRRRIGEILVNEGLITAEQLDEALNIQRKTGELLGTILMDMGLVAESDIAKTICIQYQLPFIDLSNYDFDEKLVQLLPKEFLHRHRLLPFDKIGDMLLVMVTEIPQETVLEEIPQLTNLNAALYVGFASAVSHHLDNLVPLNQTASAPAASPASKAGAAHPARGAAVAKKALVEEDEAPEDQDEGEVQDDEEENTLVFGSSKKSFLEELDSTWDSIFAQSEKSEKPGGEKKKKS